MTKFAFSDKTERALEKAQDELDSAAEEYSQWSQQPLLHEKFDSLFVKVREIQLQLQNAIENDRIVRIELQRIVTNKDELGKEVDDSFNI